MLAIVLFAVAWQQRPELTSLCSHSLLLPLCQRLCPLFSWSFSLVSLCLCHPRPRPGPPSFLRQVLLSVAGPSPGCLLCVLVTYCGDIFYIKKKYCGLLGGLTFYRTCHICNRRGKKGEGPPPFLAQGMYKHNYVRYGPFLRARFSSLWGLCSDASGGTFFFLLSSRRFLCSFLSFFCLGKPFAWEKAEKKSGLEMHDVGYVY